MTKPNAFPEFGGDNDRSQDPLIDFTGWNQQDREFFVGQVGEILTGATPSEIRDLGFIPTKPEFECPPSPSYFGWFEEARQLREEDKPNPD